MPNSTPEPTVVISPPVTDPAAPTEICEHDRLARTCDLCALIADLTEANARISRLAAECRAARRWEASVGAEDETSARVELDLCRDAVDKHRDLAPERKDA